MTKTMRDTGKVGTVRSVGDRAVSGCLTAVLVLLVCGIVLAVTCAVPVLGIALAIGGPAIAFRHQIGRNVAGVILLLLGIVQLTVLGATYERYESTDEQEWFSDGRRNPCGTREALLLVSLAFVAAGIGLFARQAWCVRHQKRIGFDGEDKAQAAQKLTSVVFQSKGTNQ